MPTLTFRGRMIPEWLELTADHTHEIDRTEQEAVEAVRFELRVEKARITVTAKTQPTSRDDHQSLFMPALDMARAFADVVCLETGKAFVATFDDVVLPSGKVMPLVLADGNLRRIFGPFLRDNFEAVVDLAHVEGHVARLLSDATVMLTWSHYAPIAAGRVAEAIRQLLTDGRSPASWAKMREMLRVDRAFVELLTDYSKNPRHGHREYVPGEVNSELAWRAWTLLGRYLALRVHGPLDPQEYPLLTGADTEGRMREPGSGLESG